MSTCWSVPPGKKLAKNESVFLKPQCFSVLLIILLYFPAFMEMGKQLIPNMRYLCGKYDGK